MNTIRRGPPLSRLRHRLGGQERGSATVLGLGAVLLLVTLLAALLVLGVALRAGLQARAAADVASLAGAAVLLEGGTTESACSAAGRLAERNGAAVLRCGPGSAGEAATAVLRVEVTVPVPVLPGARAGAVAQAGAVPAQ